MAGDTTSTRDGRNGTRADYYYVNGQRIELTKRDDLVAVVFDADARSEDIDAVTRSRSSSLTPSDEFPQMQQSNVRIYRVAGDQAQADARALARELAPEASVQKVGEVYTNPHDQPLVLTDELVCKFNADLTADQIEELKRGYELDTVMTLGFSDNAYVLRLRPDSTRNVLEAANEMVEEHRAEYCYPNFVEYVGVRQIATLPETPPAAPEEVRHGIHPTDPNFGQQWHHDNTGQVAGGVTGTVGADIRTTLAWQTTMGDPNIRLAVVDVGTDIAHTDLSTPGKLVAPINLMATPPTANPVGGAHGTQTAGMAVAAANNACAGAGSAPNCRLIAIRAGDTIPQVLMALGFAYAADNGADVITCSLGPLGAWTMTDALREAIDYATTYGRNGRGCVYFQAVDNATNAISLDQVSSYERSIAVSRTNNQDRYDGTALALPATPNQFLGPAQGPELDLCAPGRDVFLITNTVAGNACTTTAATGTSFATPLTAGVGCLVLSVNPTLSWEEVRQVMLDSADKIDSATSPYVAAPASRPPGTRNDRYGYGRVNAQGAVQRAQAGSTRDLFIRDTLLDLGTVPQPAYGFWDSPDIWVRNADDGGLTHQDTTRGRDNFIYARVSNRGSAASLPCWVRFYITTFAGTEFRYPFDYKRNTTVNPAGGTPGNLRPSASFPTPATYLVGTQRLQTVPVGGNAIAKVVWPAALIPPAANWHPCLLVEISPHDGPVAAGQHVWENNNLGQKNITIVNARRGERLTLPFRYAHALNADPFVTLTLNKLNAQIDVPVFLDLRDPKILEAVAVAAGLPRPDQIIGGPIGVDNPGGIGVPVNVDRPRPGGLGPFPGGKQPLRLTFLDEARIAVSTGEGRADDLSFVFSFPANSVVEVAQALNSALPVTNQLQPVGLGQDALPQLDGFPKRPPIGQPQAPSFSLAKFDGVNVLALSPSLKQAVVNVPLLEAGPKESSLTLEVPKEARAGDSLVFDMTQTNARGQVVGGVRLQVNVID